MVIVTVTVIVIVIVIVGGEGDVAARSRGAGQYESSCSGVARGASICWPRYEPDVNLPAFVVWAVCPHREHKIT